MNYALIFLAAGLSLRYGENKLLSKLNNKCMYEYGLNALMNAAGKLGDFASITVVTRYDEIVRHIADINNSLTNNKISCVINNESEKGISTSIKCALTDKNTLSADAYLFMVADEPNITADSILGMIKAFESKSCGILCASYEGISGNPVIFSSGYRKELLALSKDSGGKKIVASHKEDCSYYEVSCAKELEDIDIKISHFKSPFSDSYIERSGLMGYFGIPYDKDCVIALVGAGGKTTLIDMLACEIARKGRVIVATTTHMRYPAFRKVYEMGEILNELPENEKIIVVGDKGPHNKLMPITSEDISSLRKYNIPILVEADGSHCLPCKAPASHEPVIPPDADIVIGMQGSVAIGHSIKEICHRPDYVTSLLGKKPDDIITMDDLTTLLTSEMGQKKNVTCDVKYYPIINDWKI